MEAKVKRGSDQAVAVSANRLRDGKVVWRTQDGWTEDFPRAAVLIGADAQAALAAAQADEAKQLVVGSYLVEIDPTGAPLRQRERIRAAGGPTMPFGVAA
jgi:hypothetical protein